MESYYSSDEEIAWGPVTLREIKADLKKRTLRIPERRYTSHCEIKKNNKSKKNKMETPIINKSPKEVIQEDSIPEISAYLTASELASGKNEGSVSDYYSAIENTGTVSKTRDKALDTSIYGSIKDFEQLNVNDLQENKEVHKRKDNSHLLFVKNAMERPSDYMFKYERQTLVSSPICSPDNRYADSVENVSNIIEISSDEEETRNLSNVPEVSNESIDDISYTTDKDCSKNEEVFEVESYCQDIDKLSDNSINDDSMLQHITSAISIPEIDLHQFNESIDSPLNDTLENVNRLLSQAENTSISESPESSKIYTGSNSAVNHNNIDNRVLEQKHSTLDIPNAHYDYKISEIQDSVESTSKICNLISGSFLQKAQSEDKSSKYCTPIRNVSPLTKSHIPVPESFKKPNLLIKGKSVQKLSKPNLKNVVSPVGMYIKYSPNPILKQNAHSVDKKLSKFNSSPKIYGLKNKENLDVLPNVIYKPSKTQILASEKHLALPPSLDKMVIKSSVTVHDRKHVAVNLFNQNQTLNAESELTRTSLSDSQLGESGQNVSILHKRPAFRK